MDPEDGAKRDPWKEAPDPTVAGMALFGAASDIKLCCRAAAPDPTTLGMELGAADGTKLGIAAPPGSTAGVGSSILFVFGIRSRRSCDAFFAASLSPTSCQRLSSFLDGSVMVRKRPRGLFCLQTFTTSADTLDLEHLDAWAYFSL